MEVFPGFRWCVPVAFASAVGSGRFEEGDVLYREVSGYEPHGGADPTAWIQVLQPPRGSRSVGEGEGRRFVANWSSPVLLDVKPNTGAPSERVEAFQGQLFCCLWRDDRSALGAGGALPEPPRLARELRGALDGAGEAIDRAIGTGRGPSDSLFASVVDLANDASRAKARRIESALGGGRTERCWRIPPTELADLGLEGADDFHPALVIQVVLAANCSSEQVSERLQQVLYGGREGATDEEAARGRFSLSRHGLLLEGEGWAPATG